MADTQTPRARYSRVTTRRGTLRPLNCPLEPELMVAEFSGELPPDVAHAVREHIAICETCGARAVTLRTPYNLLTSLGSEPVPYVPDLRDHVRVKATATERWLRPLRMLGSISRFGLLSVGLGIILVGLLAFLLRGALDSLGVFATSRTTNSISHPAPAAVGGVLYAETNKTVSVGNGFGQTWQVAEIIEINQSTGQVIRSLPATGTLGVGSSSTLPVATATDGHTIYELTSQQNSGQQALIAINATTGAVHFTLPVTMPKGAALPSGAQAVSLALAPDGKMIYVGIAGAQGKLLDVRSLAISSAGKIVAALNPATPTDTPLPPPTSSLPASAFPSQTPIIQLSGASFSLAARGEIEVSPDGQWLFDALNVIDSKGDHYLIIRRISLATGETASTLGLPGNFHSEQLAISPAIVSPQLYLVTGSPNAMVYVMDTTATGPTLKGDIPLGGPSALNGVGLSDSLSISPTPDGLHLYIAQDAVAADNTVNAYTRWLLDTQGMSVIAGDSEATPVGSLLANESSAPKARIFALVNGDIQIGARDFSISWTPWFHASDNTDIRQMIASKP